MTTNSIKQIQLITLTEPNSPASEAYRSLRTNIMMRDFENNIKLINIASSSAQEGKSTTLLNLAIVFAQLNKRVLVVDLDLRLPTIHKKLKIRNKKGITDLVANQSTFNESVIHYMNNLDVITAGSKIPFASEFLQSTALKRKLQLFKEEYDIVLLDCPPIGVVTDGVIVSQECDGTLLVVACNQNERKELTRIKEQLDQMNVNLLGIVMTKAPISRKYDAYNSYGYTYNGTKKSSKHKKSYDSNESVTE